VSGESSLPLARPPLPTPVDVGGITVHVLIGPQGFARLEVSLLVGQASKRVVEALERTVRVEVEAR
jgi:hypothetical protein